MVRDGCSTPVCADPLMIEHSFSSVGDGGALVCKLGWIECVVCASLCASIASLITVPYGAPSPHTLCLALGPPKNPRPLFFLAFPAPQAPFFWPPYLFSGVQEVFLAAALAPTLPLRLLLAPLPPPSCHSKLEAAASSSKPCHTVTL